MNSNELMITDWVLHEGEPYQIRQLGIYGVDRDGENFPAVCIGKPIGIGLIVERNEIEPIPLTPEILEKNGFSNKGTLWYLEEDNFELEHNNNDSFIWIVGDVYIVASIKYVHELQHALRLCGIEKEIELRQLLPQPIKHHHTSNDEARKKIREAP